MNENKCPLTGKICNEVKIYNITEKVGNSYKSFKLCAKCYEKYLDKNKNKNKMKPKPIETIPAYTGNMSPQQISASQGIYQTHQQNLHQQQMQQQQQIPDPYAGLNSRDKTMLNNMFGFQ